jgi:hypothetical protein
MLPQKSAVWNYFKRSLNGNTVKCTLCDAQLTFCGGTTKFISHVKLKHPAESPTESTVKQSSLKSWIRQKRSILT